MRRPQKKPLGPRFAIVPLGLALVAAGCTVSGALPTASGGSPPSVSAASGATSASVSPFMSPIATSSPSPMASSACTSASLEARGGRQGEGGQAQVTIVLTNTGPAPCSLGGVPESLQLVRQDGTPLAVTMLPAGSLSGSPVELPPGRAGAANIVFTWSNWCGTTPGPLTAKMLLGRGIGTLDAPLDGPPGYAFVPRCDAPSQPSTIQAVFPFEAPPAG